VTSKVDRLAQRYERFCSLPWERSLAGPQRVWFAVYDKHDERRLRARVTEFEVITKRAGHRWRLVDLTDAFGEWMAGHEYRDAYFEEPEALSLVLPEFEQTVIDQIKAALEHPRTDEDTVVAVQGIACLFGFTKVSRVVNEVASSVRGRLLVFFPGEHEDNNYRLLDARDGWNYMAIPIAAHDRAET